MPDTTSPPAPDHQPTSAEPPPAADSPPDSAKTPPSDDLPEPIPVRMLNEYAYCPRLFYLMHVDGEWADNHYTVDGRYTHRRLDRRPALLPDLPADPTDPAADDDTPDPDRPVIARSVELTSPRLGLVAKLDLVECRDTHATPVDTKRGHVPRNEQRSWEPERVQLMAQALLLREHGYTADHGILYYAASKTRVPIPFTPELEAATLHHLEAARTLLHHPTLPDPLGDSPKCHGCSLAPLCLPDETLALRHIPPDPTAPETRRLYPERDDALPLYVQEQGARVGTNRGLIIVAGRDRQPRAKVPLKDLSQLVLCGNISLTPQANHLLCQAGIPIVHLSTGFYFYGLTTGLTLRNAYARAAQYRAADHPDTCLTLARTIIAAKAKNQRTMLRRNADLSGHPLLKTLAHLIDDTTTAPSIPTLLGLEGTIARHYFTHFARMLHPRDFPAEFAFEARNRRPPTDPVNALLSYTYALLAKDCTVALLAAGLDPWWGLLHQPRHGKPALALDLMEEFRPLLADSTVITLVNNTMLTAPDFITTSRACTLTPTARKTLIRAYEARLDQLHTHPHFGYRCSWRATLKVQARLLARYLRRDLPAYLPITTR